MSGICFISVLGNLFWLLRSFKYNWGLPCIDIHQPCIYTLRSHGPVYDQFFQWFPIWSSSTKDKSCLLQTFPLVLRTWDSRKQISPVKTKVKKPLSTSSLSVSFVTRTLPHLAVGQHFFCLPFVAYMSVEVLLVAFHVSCQWQLHMGFIFLKPIPLHSDSVYIFLLSDLFFLPSLTYLLFMSEFSQEFLVHLFSSPDTFAWFAHQDGAFLHLEVVILEKKQLTWTLPPFRPSPMAFFQVAPWSGEVCSFYYCSAICCVSLRTLFPNIAWSLQPKCLHSQVIFPHLEVSNPAEHLSSLVSWSFVLGCYQCTPEIS